MLTTNTPAPTFSLPDQNQQIHNLADYVGNWLVIYFYPKDDTPGCTTQACNLRDAWQELKNQNVAIIGISKDSPESHKKFVQKFSLPFALLADETTQIIQAYGAWQERSMYGKKFMGTARISYLIDPQGVIRNTYPKVNPSTFASEILSDLNIIQVK